MIDKIKTDNDLELILQKLRKERKKVVFTNGCFDLIHVGHIRYLQKAKEYGNILVVALNSDESVKKIKGTNRPILSQQERAEILAALEFIDYVVIFDESTPLRLIKKLKPDFLIKGGDWTIDKIVGRDFVESYGGKVIAIPTVEGASTTNLIERILEKLF